MPRKNNLFREKKKILFYIRYTCSIDVRILSSDSSIDRSKRRRNVCSSTDNSSGVHVFNFD